MNKELIDAAKQLIIKNEGIRCHVYLDILKIPTIGIGFNLKRPDAKLRIESVGGNYDLIFDGKSELSIEQCNALFEFDLNDCINDLTNFIKDFVNLPIDVKLVLIDMRYNLGPIRFRKFKSTIREIEDHKYKNAADRIVVTPYYQQVGRRAAYNCDLLYKSGNH